MELSSTPIMDKISEFVASIIFYSIDISPLFGVEQEIGILLILVWLVVASVFLTFYMGFINFRFFKHGIDLVMGRAKNDKEAQNGEISRFQALMTTMSGTVGLGNIAGVAVAISVGGAGAAFWMFFMGFFGMTTKFVEATLGVKYRHHPNTEHKNKIYGGPMYYIRDAFSNRGLPLIGSILAACFAVFCFVGALGAAPLFQTNQAVEQLGTIIPNIEEYKILIGILIAILVGAVIIGGIKSIAKVASAIVPFMGVAYILMGITVLVIYADKIPEALSTIINSAFSLEAGIGALLGAIIQGVRRAAFSNEAGIGSAAIGHSAVKTNQPVSQGFVAMLGPFIDTCIICMITALVIVITNSYDVSNANMEGVALTSRAFESAVSWFPYLLVVIVQLFAFSTIISWTYYGVKSWAYIFGEKLWVENIYKLIICLCIIVGATAELGSIIDFTDAMIFAMAVPNIIALYILAPEVKSDLKKYIAKLKEAEKDIKPEAT